MVKLAVRTSRLSATHPQTACIRSGFPDRARRGGSVARGSGLAQYAFTLIELLVVMAIIALLLTIAMPRYWQSTDKARESVLRQDLAHMRVAIDQYHADRGRYPDSIEDLVEKKYLKAIPRDPMTESAQTWVVVPPPDASNGSIYDVRSGAPGTARDGTRYSDW